MARDWRFVLIAPSVGTGLRFLPQSSLALGGGLGLEMEPWRVLARASYHDEVDVLLAGSSGRGARVGRRTAHMAACRALGRGRIRLAPCLTLTLQHLVARGIGPDVASGKADHTWMAFGPSAAAQFRLSEHLGFGAGVGLEVQTARPVFVIEGLGEVEQVGALELTGLMGAEWIF
jgi:hypothetical protein